MGTPSTTVLTRREVANRIGGILRDRRIAQGYSKKAVAEAVGVSVRYVGLVETGQRVPGPSMLAQWCTLLGSDVGSTFSIMTMAMSLYWQTGGEDSNSDES
ncbi:MAG: helix-turn-helix transcriptional regulator [Nitrospirae bacterium]|nr:helix-turn-helix transcriptional regulator [Nitrospirota bacterium]